MIEYIERPVKLVKCSKNNIKITTPEDVAQVRSILKKRLKDGESEK